MLYEHISSRYKSARDASFSSVELQQLSHYTLTGNARERFEA